MDHDHCQDSAEDKGACPATVPNERTSRRPEQAPELVREQLDRCQEVRVHTREVDAVRRQLQDEAPEEATLELAELFKVLGDSTRVRILKALSFSSLCVCDLADLMGMSASAISHHLRQLRAARLVRFRKDGKNVFYSLDDAHVEGLLRLGFEYVREG